MNTANIVLLAVLCAIIGFNAGNAYGQQKMKIIVGDIIKRLTEGLTKTKGEDLK